MPSIGARCYELRIQDKDKTWRIIYRIDPDAVVITEVFAKTTQVTPKHVIATSQKRLRSYDEIAGGR
jgi:phage-related protein